LVRRLQKQFDVSLEGNAAAGPVCAERVDPKHVVALLASESDGGNAVARKLLQKSRHREGLTESLRGHDDTRFARLEKAMEADSLSSVIVTSALNIQEFTGLPMRGKRRALAAIYSKDSGLWLISHGSSGEANLYSSFKDACNDLMADGRIGVEMDDMPAWMYASAGLGERDCVAADLLVRKWRDESTLPDLAFYILAARASVHAIEKALEFASRNLDTGRTEMDAYKVYLDELYGFVAEHAPALRVARTLTNFHSGNRTIFPSNPAPHPLERKINTLKIDAGCMIFDRRGTLLGCSDIARTLCLTKDGTELYELFRKSTVDRLMPACGDGTDGKTIHRLAVEDLKPVGSLQNTLGRKVQKLSDFNRDVGHELGKNNLSHLQFTASDAGKLRAGMIACCEYQWPLKEHTVSYEDTGLVTGEGGLNFTVD
jgi:Xaa-Pro aminopeptidase